MKLFLSYTLFVLPLITQAQDGSNIQYVKRDDADGSLVGKIVQFDFYHRSFHGTTSDTIDIMIVNEPVKFVEVRHDDGRNNWFAGQYLESIEKFNGRYLRISKMKMLRVKRDFFLVMLYVDHYDNLSDDAPVKTQRKIYRFLRRFVNEVLVEKEP